MALRNQPYFPLYVNDFLSDEKLIPCSAESTGVYIRIMCLMHKSDEYGVILLHQKFKQNVKPTLNFATQLAMFLPYTVDVVERSLDDLIDNKVLTLDGDRLIQKRMVKDEKISQIRVISGSKGGKKSSESRVSVSKNKEAISSNFPIAKSQPNSEYVNEYEYVNEDSNVSSKKNTSRFKKPTVEEVAKYCTERGNRINAQNFVDFYESKGWKVGGSPMKDWKAAIRTWEQRDKDKTPDKPKTRYFYPDENGNPKEGWR